MRGTFPEDATDSIHGALVSSRPLISEVRVKQVDASQGILKPTRGKRQYRRREESAMSEK